MLRQWVKRRLQESRLIRTAVNTYPDGICFAAADGRPVLTNQKMNTICFQLTGSTVVNAKDMWTKMEALCSAEGNRKVRDDLLVLQIPQDGSVWQIQKSNLEISSQEMYQLEASDITELFHVQRQLEINNRHLKELHDRQRIMLDNIISNNLDKEILHAKMGIHDDFGRLLIMTNQVMEEQTGRPEAGELVDSWNNVISAMEHYSGQDQGESSSPLKELEQVAALIGCRIVFRGEQPENRNTRLLLYAAIREALTNAVRHADADEITVDIRDQDDACSVVISSNGKPPAVPIREGGGLSTLRRRLEQDGAAMQIVCGRSVELHLCLPKE